MKVQNNFFADERNSQLFKNEVPGEKNFIKDRINKEFMQIFFFIKKALIYSFLLENDERGRILVNNCRKKEF